MNYKKTYVSAKGYTPICKIGECSLNRLEFGIIELDANEKTDFFTGDKETAFIMLEGHCNVYVGTEKWENVGNRSSVFENRKAESFYMPIEQDLTIEAIDHLKIAVCATPLSEKTDTLDILSPTNIDILRTSISLFQNVFISETELKQ